MTPTDILKDAESDFAALAKLPGEIRDRVKAGAAELTAIRDEVDATIKTMLGTANAQLASLKATASAVAQGVAAKV